MRLRPAYAAVAGAFLLNGLIFGTLAARLPALQSGLGLTDGELALALVALNGGALVGLQAGAMLTRRFGTRATLRVALPTFALLLMPIAAAPTLPALAAALAGSAAVNSVVDVAVNANGLTVERRYGHPVLSRLHAMLTLGGIIGAGIAAGVATLGAGVHTHFATVATIGIGGAVLLPRWLATESPRPLSPRRRVDGAGSLPNPPRVGPRRRSRAGRLLGLGGLACCVTLAEGSGNDWTAVYLHGLGASEAFAASGVATFLGAMTAGRFAGDHLRDRIDAVPLVRGAALVAAVGLGLALLIRHPVAGLTGFGLLGLGLSITLPVILAVASQRAAQDGVPPAVTIARVSAMAYLGSFVGPGLIGALATTTSLGTALFLPVAVAATAALAAEVLAPRVSSPMNLFQPPLAVRRGRRWKSGRMRRAVQVEKGSIQRKTARRPRER
ncbi:MFS transporter [Plantactinospora mayteni]|uniref:Major facilitator superfamily (MFS) profile domain-containing protein n=1 Tax=Plantactinospora mayteni TaxID=566021 RepID=A0ABQ4F237_9ACTN|nr:MFS transporter [Plantactinospora mayteni]GIH00910.1 hypothetical protein Pma05_74820 [Plantactinospora mayteni]